jgi:phospholipid/cholesterol/gamma-HCH transport system substrate-binding protein
VDALEQMQDDLQEAVNALTAAAQDASTLMRSVNTVVETNSEQFTTVLQKSSAALDQFQRTAANVDRLTTNVERTSTSIDAAARDFATASQAVTDVFGDPQLRTNLQKTLEEMPVLLKESRETVAAARNTVATVQESFSSFRQTNEKLNRNLDNMEGFTQRLGADGPRVLERMDRTLVDVQELLDELTNFGTALNQRDGTLGKLINDPDLYLRLNNAAANIESATQQLCPILEDARVAMDKVARDPGGTVGVRGILDRSPGGLKKVRPAGW